MVPDPVNQSVIPVRLLGREASFGNHLKDVHQGLARLDRLLGVIGVCAALADFLGSQSEEEEVLLPNLLKNFDIGPVQRPDGQRPVHHELHVPGARRFFPGGGDLLGQVRSRDHPLGHRHVVVRRIDDLQQVTRQRVIVNNLGHIIDQPYDFLRHRIARRGLSAENLDPGHPSSLRVRPDPLPMRDGLEDVQQLPLVFMDALDLHVEHRVGRDLHPHLAPDPVRQAHLVLALGRREFRPEPGFPCQRLQLTQTVKVSLPRGAGSPSATNDEASRRWSG